MSVQGIGQQPGYYPLVPASDTKKQLAAPEQVPAGTWLRYQAGAVEQLASARFRQLETEGLSPRHQNALLTYHQVARLPEQQQIRQLLGVDLYA